MSGAVAFPTIFRRDQRNGRLIAVFRLAGDEADRLVDQHRDLACLRGFARRDRSRCADPGGPSCRACRCARRRPAPSLFRSTRRLRGASTGRVPTSAWTDAGCPARLRSRDAECAARHPASRSARASAPGCAACRREPGGVVAEAACQRTAVSCRSCGPDARCARRVSRSRRARTIAEFAFGAVRGRRGRHAAARAGRSERSRSRLYRLAKCARRDRRTTVAFEAARCAVSYAVARSLRLAPRGGARRSLQTRARRHAIARTGARDAVATRSDGRPAPRGARPLNAARVRRRHGAGRRSPRLRGSAVACDRCLRTARRRSPRAVKRRGAARVSRRAHVTTRLRSVRGATFAIVTTRTTVAAPSKRRGARSPSSRRDHGGASSKRRGARSTAIIAFKTTRAHGRRRSDAVRVHRDRDGAVAAIACAFEAARRTFTAITTCHDAAHVAAIARTFKPTRRTRHRGARSPRAFDAAAHVRHRRGAHASPRRLHGAADDPTACPARVAAAPASRSRENEPSARGARAPAPAGLPARRPLAAARCASAFTRAPRPNPPSSDGFGPAGRVGLRADVLPVRTGARSDEAGRGCLAVNLTRMKSHTAIARSSSVST